MDVLSSMAMLAGYKAVLMAERNSAAYVPHVDDGSRFDQAAEAPHSWSPGLPGLQAIATGRRLGAVEAFDVRAAVGKR